VEVRHCGFQGTLASACSRLVCEIVPWLSAQVPTQVLWGMRVPPCVRLEPARGPADATGWSQLARSDRVPRLPVFRRCPGDAGGRCPGACPLELVSEKIYMDSIVGRLNGRRDGLGVLEYGGA